MSGPIYGVWATVHGGATGSRSAWVKSNSEPLTFDTLAEAEAHAAALNERTVLRGGFTPSGRPIAVASYRALERTTNLKPLRPLESR